MTGLDRMKVCAVVGALAVLCLWTVCVWLDVRAVRYEDGSARVTWCEPWGECAR